MDQHFSTEIAKYTKSTNILVGFNLYTPIIENGVPYQKVLGMIVSHAAPQIKNEQNYISTFKVVLNWNKSAYKNAVSDEEKERLTVAIDTENINSYEVATTNAAVPRKWPIPKASSVSR